MKYKSHPPLLLAAVIASMSALPATAELYFSEYIEGSSNNKALEIYNSSANSVDLSGHKVEMYFNGNTTATLTINLTGNIPANGVFVLAHGSANATILTKANQTNSAGWFNGDDAIVLKNGTTILDSIGQVGFDPGRRLAGGSRASHRYDDAGRDDAAELRRGRQAPAVVFSGVAFAISKRMPIHSR